MLRNLKKTGNNKQASRQSSKGQLLTTELLSSPPMNSRTDMNENTQVNSNTNLEAKSNSNSETKNDFQTLQDESKTPNSPSYFEMIANKKRRPILNTFKLNNLLTPLSKEVLETMILLLARQVFIIFFGLSSFSLLTI